MTRNAKVLNPPSIDLSFLNVVGCNSDVFELKTQLKGKIFYFKLAPAERRQCGRAHPSVHIGTYVGGYTGLIYGQRLFLVYDEERKRLSGAICHSLPKIYVQHLVTHLKYVTDRPNFPRLIKFKSSFRRPTKHNDRTTVPPEPTA